MLKIAPVSQGTCYCRPAFQNPGSACTALGAGVGVGGQLVSFFLPVRFSSALPTFPATPSCCCFFLILYLDPCFGHLLPALPDSSSFEPPTVLRVSSSCRKRADCSSTVALVFSALLGGTLRCRFGNLQGVVVGVGH